MPADLVHRIAQRKDGSYDASLAQKVKRCTKIHFAQPGLMWVISPSWGIPSDEAHANEDDPGYEESPPAPPGQQGKCLERSCGDDQRLDSRTTGII